MAGRKPKVPPSPFNGITIEQWQNSDPYVQWARTDPMFSLVMAVVQNGMLAVPPDQFAGYRAALMQLMAMRVSKVIPQRTPNPTYSEPLSEMDVDREQPED